MAKQTINIGSAANDGTGDPLRTAFDKINDNFDEIYTELGGNTVSNISFSGNTIGTDVGTGNLQLTADGGAVVVDSSITLQLTDHTDDALVKFDADGNLVDSTITFDGTTITAGDITIDTTTGTIGTTANDITLAPGAGDVLPAGNELESLGNASQAWLTVWARRLNITHDRFSLGVQYTPATSVGLAGDAAGDVSFDDSYIYYCIAPYDGSSNIWVRVALDATPW